MPKIKTNRSAAKPVIFSHCVPSYAWLPPPSLSLSSTHSGLGSGLGAVVPFA